MNTNTKNNRVMKAMTGLSLYEFEQLVPAFEEKLYLHQLNRPGRTRKPGGGIKGHLPDATAKLFFILFYIKAYPTFDVLGCLHGKSSGRTFELPKIKASRQWPDSWLLEYLCQLHALVTLLQCV
jgi:hypothetical protein